MAPRAVTIDSAPELEHLEVPAREEVDCVELRERELALPHVRDERKVVIRGVDGVGRYPAVIVELAACAQVENGPYPERRDTCKVRALDAVDAIGPVEETPTHGAPVAPGVTAEVTEVERTFERDPPRTGVRFDLHVQFARFIARTVPGVLNRDLAGD